MTKLRLLALLAVVAIIVALIPAVASAQSVPPCRIHGTVQVDGVNVDAGTVITATVDGDTYNTTTPSAYGASTYLIEIAQPEGKSYAGKMVTFMIGADSAAQTATWVQGGNLVVNLTKGEAPLPSGEGLIKSVVVNTLAAGASATVSWNATTGVLTLGIPAGAKGDTGAAGAAGTPGTPGTQGPKGDTGAGSSAVLGIVALILAVIAVLGVGYAVFVRK